MNIKIIGTSHVAQQSIQEIKQAFEEFKPDIVAVELDVKRLQALLSGQKTKVRLSDIRKIGLKGFLFSLIGSFIQRKIGKKVGLAPGSDMLTAVKLAQEKNASIALIDQDIETTLRKFSQSLSWKERFRFFVDMLKGLFMPKKELKKYHLEGLDLSKVPEEKIIKKMIKQLKERYPNIYRVLVEERNQIIIKKLKNLIKLNPDKKILVVVGAGHKEDIKEKLNKLKKED